MKEKVRVALFGSHYRGYFVLQELLHGEMSDRLQLVGVASDDPTQTFVSPHKRLWQYEHTRSDETLVPDAAKQAGLEVYLGRVKTPEFYETYEKKWKPDICFSSTFGQRFDNRLISFPKFGFLNVHTSGDTWPSYPGPDAVERMINDGKRYVILTLHKVNELFDNGEFIARSKKIWIPPNTSIPDLFKIAAPYNGELVTQYLKSVLE
jgi:methionyl-tRNA formyltransferase